MDVVVHPGLVFPWVARIRGLGS